MRFLRRLAFAAFAIGSAACSGGGCSALAPLDSAFPAAEGVDNAASVNVTQEGFGFLAANAPSLVGGIAGGASLAFDIAPASGTIFSTIDYTICMGGPDPAANPRACQVALDIAGASLDVAPTSPHAITVSGPVPFLLSQLPLHLEAGCAPIINCLEKSDVLITIDGSGSATCPGTTYADVALTGLDVELATDREASHLRHGYTGARVEDVDSTDLDTLALVAAMHFCPADPANSDDVATADVLNTYKDLVFAGMKTTLFDTLNTALGALTCQPADPMAAKPCPEGSDANDDGICVYPDGLCVTPLLGIDGHADLGALLSSIASGTVAGLDMVLASGGLTPRADGSGELTGDMEPVAGGATLGFLGGAKAAPPSSCVPPSNAVRPKGIPVPDELRGTALPDWPASSGPAPHLGLAISERYLTYLLAGVYDSGALCLGLSGSALGDLGSPIALSSASGALLGAPSLRYLGIQQDNAEIVMYLHPLAAPTMTIGSGASEDDPLMRLGLPNMALDLYVWTYDRFVRAFAAKLSVEVDIGLEASAAGITPTIDGLHVGDVEVTVSPILGDPKEPIATALEGLLGDVLASSGILDQALPAVDVGSLLGPLGVGMSIPKEGIRKLTKGDDDFVGLFATLTLAPAP